MQLKSDIIIEYKYSVQSVKDNLHGQARSHYYVATRPIRKFNILY